MPSEHRTNARTAFVFSHVFLHLLSFFILLKIHSIRKINITVSVYRYFLTPLINIIFALFVFVEFLPIFCSFLQTGEALPIFTSNIIFLYPVHLLTCRQFN